MARGLVVPELLQSIGKDAFQGKPGEALLAEVACAGGLPAGVVLVEGAVEVGAADLVQAPVVGDLGQETGEPERAQGSRKLPHPEPGEVRDHVGADQGPVYVEDGCHLPGLLVRRLLALLAAWTGGQ